MSKENFSALSKTLPAATRFPNSRLPCVLYCNRSTFLPFARRLLPHATSSNYSSPTCKTSLGRNFADYRNGSSRSAMNSITSSQNERTLAGQTAVSLRSELDCEVTCGAVKGQDERRPSAAPLTAPPVTRSSMQHGRKQARFHGKTDKTGGPVGRPSCQSSLLTDPNAKFSAEMWRKPQRTRKVRRAATSALTFMTFS